MLTNKQIQLVASDLFQRRWTNDASVLWAECEVLANENPGNDDLPRYVAALTAMDELGWHESSPEPMRSAVYAMLEQFAEAVLDARGVAE